MLLMSSLRSFFRIEGHDETGACSFNRLNLYISLVEVHNLLAQVQSYSRTVLFRAEEGHKDLIQQFGRDAMTIIRHFHNALALLIRQGG